MLILDQLQELNGILKKALDVMRYDVSISPLPSCGRLINFV
jgi:hypothetical protein